MIGWVLESYRMTVIINKSVFFFAHFLVYLEALFVVAVIAERQAFVPCSMQW